MQAIPQRMREMIEARSQFPPEPWLDLDLTMKQLKVLFLLEALESARPSVIAEAIGLSAASATGVLDRLAEQGYVERQADSADRRAVLVRLTQGGTRVVSDLYMCGQT